MKLRGRLIAVGLMMLLVVTECSRTNMAVVAEQVGEGIFNGIIDIAATPGIAFETLEVNAPADTPFTINFDNPGALGHNLVVVETPDQIDAVAASADPNGNLEEDVDGVLAYSQVIAGASEEVPVDEGLAAGEYTYICTVPGHTANMRGTLIVE